MTTEGGSSGSGRDESALRPPQRQDAPDPINSAFVMAVQVLNAGRASLLIREDGDPLLTMAAAVGIPPSVVEQIEVHDGEGLAGNVAEKGYSLLGRSRNGETFVISPVVTDERIQGVLCLSNRLSPRQFTSADVASSNSIADHMAHLLEYRRDSMIDELTRLPNEKSFTEALERELSRSKRFSRSFSLAYLDVDGLKLANDTGGHATGDRLLRSVGNALRNATRQYDFPARLHGDEFAVILADSEDSGTALRDRVTQGVGDIGLRYYISLGVAHFPDDGETAEALLRVADERMYEFKRRNSGDGESDKT